MKFVRLLKIYITCRHVGIRCLEGDMSGNNINKAGIIGKEYAGLGSPESLPWMSNGIADSGLEM